jgi:EpsI family protein
MRRLLSRLFGPVGRVCLVLALQSAFVYAVALRRTPPVKARLDRIPALLGQWSAVDDRLIPDEIIRRLSPDGYLQRMYQRQSSGETADLFIAYFGSSEIASPHTPSDCLRGAGWAPLSSEAVSIPGDGEIISGTRHLAQKSGETLLVYYWFQNSVRTASRESVARIRMLPDILRYNRSDIALVRLAIPVKGGDETAKFALLKELGSEVHSALAAALGGAEAARLAARVPDSVR